MHRVREMVMRSAPGSIKSHRGRFRSQKSSNSLQKIIKNAWRKFERQRMSLKPGTAACRRGAK
jgi:hypothetical protein